MPPRRRVSKASKPESGSVGPPEAKKRRISAEETDEQMKTDEVSEKAISKDFASTCRKLESLLESANEMKKTDSPSESDMAECNKNVCLHVMTLRRLNRTGQVRCKEARDKTIRCRQDIDGLNLQLQNLLYHVMHLQGEIRECREFKSRDEDIDLVSEDEFYKDAPPVISNPEETAGNDHKKMLAQLHWEMEQRKRLTCQLHDATSEKSAVKKDIQAKGITLSCLQPQLDTILKATLPVQELMSLPFEKERAQRKLAFYLPEPMYVLFVQLSAFQEALDPELEVSIEGDLEEAKLATMAKKSHQFDNESDSDNEQEASSAKRKKRRRTVDDTLLQKRADLLKLFPLFVRLNRKQQNASLQIDFHYVISLKIVSTKVRLDTSVKGDILKCETLLSWLFPGDDGLTSPNPANQFWLRKLGIDGNLFASYSDSMGIPYKWAQSLAGLNFHSEKSSLSPSALSVSRIELIMEAVKGRLASRMTLQEQLHRFDSLEIVDVPEASHCFPPHINTDLSEWKETECSSLSEYPSADAWIREDLIDENDYLFEATFQNGQSELKALVVIKPQYPSIPPVFILSRNGMGAQKDCNIKGLEAEVNVHYHELVSACSPKWLLSLQMKRLMMCFDIYCECESSEREKLYFRVARGKDRGRPYVYDSELSAFKHR